MNYHTRTKTLHTNHRDTVIVYALLTCISVLCCLYVYFISASVMHVVMRTETERAMGDIQSEISKLETELMLAHHRVSAEVASMAGYVETTERIFVDRSSHSLVLGDNRER